MNRTPIAIVVCAVAIGAILAGAYGGFFALAAQFPPGRTLGLLSAALMIASGLACAGVVAAAAKWLHAARPNSDE